MIDLGAAPGESRSTRSRASERARAASPANKVRRTISSWPAKSSKRCRRDASWAWRSEASASSISRALASTSRAERTRSRPRWPARHRARRSHPVERGSRAGHRGRGRPARARSSVANAASRAPNSENRSRARVRSDSAAAVSPRSAATLPRLRSSRASQRRSPAARNVAIARSVSAPGWRRPPADHRDRDPEHVRARELVLVEAGAGGIELAQRGPDRTLARQQVRKTAAGHSRPPRQAISIRGPDRRADRRLRAGVAELGPGEAERVQRGDLGLTRADGSGELQRSLGQRRRLGGVDLDSIERLLGQRERFESNCDGRHRAYVSAGVRRARVLHRISPTRRAQNAEDRQ